MRNNINLLDFLSPPAPPLQSTLLRSTGHTHSLHIIRIHCPIRTKGARSFCFYLGLGITRGNKYSNSINSGHDSFSSVPRSTQFHALDIINLKHPPVSGRPCTLNCELPQLTFVILIRKLSSAQEWFPFVNSWFTIIEHPVSYLHVAFD